MQSHEVSLKMSWIRPLDSVTWIEIKIIETHSQPVLYLLSPSPPPPVSQVRLRFRFHPQMCMRVRSATRTWCWAGPSLSLEAGSRLPSLWNGSDLLSLTLKGRLVSDHQRHIPDQTAFVRMGTPPKTESRHPIITTTSMLRKLPQEKYNISLLDFYNSVIKLSNLSK